MPEASDAARAAIRPADNKIIKLAIECVTDLRGEKGQTPAANG